MTTRPDSPQPGAAPRPRSKARRSQGAASTPRSAKARLAERRRNADGGATASGALAAMAAAPPTLRAAIGTAALGALLLAAGPLAGVAGPAAGPSFTSWPLLAVLAVLPVAVAALFLARGRPMVAVGVLTASALLAPGRAIVDMQLVADAGLAARPELLVPTTLAALHAGAGVALLLAGHAATAVAGLLAFAGADEPGPAVRLGRTAAAGQFEAGQFEAGEFEAGEPAHSGTASGGQGPLAIALCAGVVAAVGLVAAPFRSDDPYVLARAVVDAPTWVLIGGLLTAFAVPLAAGLAASASEPATRRGGLFGTAAVVAAVAAPPLAAGLFSPALHATWGPVVALLAAATLAAMAWPAGREAPTRGGDGSTLPAGLGAGGSTLPAGAGGSTLPAGAGGSTLPAGAGGSTLPAGADGSTLPAGADGSRLPAGLGARAEITLPSQARLQTVAGGFGVVAGGSAFGGALLTQIVVPDGAPPFDDYAARLLLPAGLLVIGLAVAMLFGRATAVRPAFTVALAALPLAAAGALEVVLTASNVSGVRTGPGVWMTGLALAAALAAACCAGLAGAVERDDIDRTEIVADRRRFAPAAVAAVLAVAAFGLPTVTAPNFVPAGLWTHFRTESWGLLCGVLVVLGATALSPWCRRERAVSLLLGAAGVVGIRVLELPLTGGRAPGSAVGAGTWFAAACGVVLIVGAVAAWRGDHHSRRAVTTR